jgi:hypothetical protein
VVNGRVPDTPDPGHERFAERHDGADGDGRIERVASLAKNVEPQE